MTWEGEIRLEDGTLLGRLLDASAASLTISPRSSAGLYLNWEGSRSPRHICPSKSWDIFALSTVANLTAELEVARLPGNAGLVLRGTASDRHLERFELDFARTDEPEAWHPIGAAFDVPVVNDTFSVWVPPGPGTYVVRLRVRDRAGSSRTRTRTVSWDRAASLVNFTQSTYFLSPDGNGLKDEVVFRYLVAEPTRLDIRVVGPEPVSGDAPAAGEVRRVAFEYSATGSQSFTWDGTDEGNRLVPDGRYTVFLNDLPFRVEVDVTPPEIDLRFEGARAEPQEYSLKVPRSPPICMEIEGVGGAGTTVLGGVFGDQVWHVVDPHLKAWALSAGPREVSSGTETVYVAETSSSGEPRFENGVPVVRREGGRPASRRDAIQILDLAQYDGFTFAAEDHAGNRSEVSVPPVAEWTWALGAAHDCRPLMAPPIAAEPVVHGLAAENVLMLAGSSARSPSGTPDLRFTFQPREGGDEWELPVSGIQLPISSFEALGADPTDTYRGRFVATGSSGEVASDDFLFTPCPQSIRTKVVGGGLFAWPQLNEPVAEVRASLWRENTATGKWDPFGSYAMEPLLGDSGAYVLVLAAWRPARPCALQGRRRGAQRNASTRTAIFRVCQKVEGTTLGGCQFRLRFSQDFPGCGGSPDQLGLALEYFAEQPARLEVEGGAEASPVLLFEADIAASMQEPLRFTHWADVAGVPAGPFPVRGRLVPVAPELEPVAAEASFVIDRSPPMGEVLVPPEGGSVCLATGPASSPAGEPLRPGRGRLPPGRGEGVRPFRRRRRRRFHGSAKTWPAAGTIRFQAARPSP